MIRINLLPFRVARKRESVRRQVSFFLLLLGFVTGGFLLHHLYVGNRINSLQAQVAKADTEIKRYQEIGKQVDKNKKKIEVINKKKSVINSLIKDRYKQVRLLSDMTEFIIADKMWLTSLSIQGTGVRIKGVAMDERTVADFMTNLEKSELFPVVNLSTVKRKTFDETTNLKEFEVACQTAMPQSVRDKHKQGQKK